MTRDARLDALALGSNCHRCAASADEPCRTPSARVTQPHQARIDRAIAQYVTAKRVAEIEAVAEAAEPEVEEFVGEVEPTCPKCRYLSGHASWCPESPLAGLDGEIRTDESGVARYWTAAEIALLREVEAAQRAEPATCAVDGQPLIRMSDGSWAHQASHLDGHPGHPAPGLTDADVRAIASGHPAGSIRRARLLS
jgi:hypothetical protein